MPNLISDPQSHSFSDSMTNSSETRKSILYSFFLACFQALENSPLWCHKGGHGGDTHTHRQATVLPPEIGWNGLKENSETSISCFRGENRNAQCFQLASDPDAAPDSSNMSTFGFRRLRDSKGSWFFFLQTVKKKKKCYASINKKSYTCTINYKARSLHCD